MVDLDCCSETSLKTGNIDRSITHVYKRRDPTVDWRIPVSAADKNGEDSAGGLLIGQSCHIGAPSICVVYLQDVLVWDVSND